MSVTRPPLGARLRDGETSPDDWRPRSWALAKLSLAVVLALTTWFSATAVMPQLRDHWSVTPAESVWLAIAVQLGFILGALASAVTSLSDLLPPRVLMAAAAALVGLVNLLLLVARSADQAIALRVLTGVLLAGVYPPALKFISTWFQKGRGIALGCVIGALTLGSAMPHAINALGGLGWRGVIAATSGATFAGAALILFALREGPFPFPKVAFEPREIGAALSDRRFLLCTLGYLGHMWELYAMWSWLLFFVTARLKALGQPDPAWASALTFFIIAAGTPACVAAGVIADRFGRPVTLTVVQALPFWAARLDAAKAEQERVRQGHLQAQCDSRSAMLGVHPPGRGDDVKEAWRVLVMRGDALACGLSRGDEPAFNALLDEWEGAWAPFRSSIGIAKRESRLRVAAARADEAVSALSAEAA